MRYVVLIIAVMATLQGKTQHWEQIADSLFARLSARPSPGISIIVLKQGEPVFSKSYGMADIEHQVPFSINTPVRLPYADGREFMAVGLVMMEKKNLLDIGDKVRKYFPDLPKWSDPVTIRDLLNHSSGFVDEWATLLLTQASMGNRLDPSQFLRLLYNQPGPQVEPGKGYLYCNSDYALLRLIMEKASGRPLPDFLHDELFGPLGMRQTMMNDDLSQIIPGLAQSYATGQRVGKIWQVKSSPGGNYRIVTSAADLQRWSAFCRDSSSNVSKALERLRDLGRPIPVLKDKHYPFGQIEITKNGIPLIRHGGIDENIYLTRIPGMGLEIIAFSNDDVLRRRADQLVWNAIGVTLNVSAKAGKVPVLLPVKGLKDSLLVFEGRYFSMTERSHSSSIRPIRYYDLRWETDGLQLYVDADQKFPLTYAGNGLFYDPGSPEWLRFQPKGNEMTLTIQDDGGMIDSLVRAADAGDGSWKSSSYLYSFEGNYYSKHLDYYFKITLGKDHKLWMRRPTVADKELIPIGEDQFVFKMESWPGTGWNVLARFTRDTKGVVTGIDLQHIRMFHHRLEKQD